jgi:hypothetical protein
MDDVQLQANLLDVARKLFRLETQRDALNDQIAAAETEHLALLKQATAPPAQPATHVGVPQPSAPQAHNGAPVGVAGTTVPAAPGPTPATHPRPAPQSWKDQGISARVRALRFLATFGQTPVAQEKAVEALVSQGVDAKTAEQALYDMSSVKVGWLDRNSLGLVVNAAGREALKTT